MQTGQICNNHWYSLWDGPCHLGRTEQETSIRWFSFYRLPACEVPPILLRGLWKGTKESKQNASPLSRDLHRSGNRKRVHEQRRWKSTAGSHLRVIQTVQDGSLFLACDIQRPETICHDTVGVHAVIWRARWKGKGRQGKARQGESRQSKARRDRRTLFTRKSPDWSLPSSDTFLNWSIPILSHCFYCATFPYSRVIFSWSFFHSGCGEFMEKKGDFSHATS